MEVHVIGAGLAGSEAAWQLAERGVSVRLSEMRPHCMTPAHQTDRAAEMVCSNSFKSDDPVSATGILKAEMKAMGSMILACAEQNRVPAGASLAVDREAFAQAVTERLAQHPNIKFERRMAARPEEGIPTIIATGPLTADPLADWLASACGAERLHFYDAIAPIVLAESIDEGVAFRASRYGKGGADFLNCPLDREEYERFLDALLAAEKASLHDFDTPFFEACLPIEVMAERGRETLRYGPMKPVGLDDPRTGRWPHAVVQLRQDTLAGDHYNLVGFQTRLKWDAQKSVFRMIPGLQNAEFVRLGSIHRNTYLKAPEALDATLALKRLPSIWVAGQLSGVEGYLESAAAGMAAAIGAWRGIRGLQPLPFPRESMLGALLNYLGHADPEGFSPTNAMLGLLPALPEAALDFRSIKRTGGARAVKAARGGAYRERALVAMAAHLHDNGWLP